MRNSWTFRAILAALLLPALLLPACGSSDSKGTSDPDAGPQDSGLETCQPVVPPTQTVDFAAPQAVVFADPYLVVANTNGAFDAATSSMVYGPGILTVIEAATGKIVNHIETTAKNPQKLVVHGDRLFILNSGTLKTDADGRFVSDTPGSIDFLPVSNLDRSPKPHGHTEIPFSATDPTLGNPVDMAFAGERAYITSGTSNAVFVFNAGNGNLEHGADDPLLLGAEPRVALGNITANGKLLYVTDFNADTLYRIDGQDDSVSTCGLDLGASADMEGAGAPRVLGDSLYYLMGMSGVIGHRTLADVEAAFADPACPALGLGDSLGPLGQYPNTMEPLEDRLYVVESGENQVSAWTTAGEAAQKFELPEGSNPFGLAISADGRYLAVTEYVANGVKVFDRACDGLAWELATAAAGLE